MVIKIFRSWTNSWMPTCDAWEKYRHILRPLCVSGVIAYKSKEALIAYFLANGITAEEDTGNSEEEITTEQLLMF